MFKSFLCAAAVVASVFAQDSQFSPAMNIVTKSDDQSLNNQFVSISRGRVGLFEPARSTGNGATVFNTVSYNPTNTLTLLVNQDWTRQIVLGGKASLLELREVVNKKGPSAADFKRGEAFEWSVFTLDSTSAFGVKDNSVIPSRQWVAINSGDGLYLALWDGFTPLTGQQYKNVTLQAVSALT